MDLRERRLASERIASLGALRDFLTRNGRLRLLTGDYLGVTEQPVRKASNP